MFTSKKALYLNNKLDRISPITNIESLYYELAYISSDSDASYIIERKAVTKHMPIRFDVSHDLILNISTSIVNTPYFDISAGQYTDISLNIDYIKTPGGTNLYLVYTVDSSKVLDLLNILKNYAPSKYFNSSINIILGNLNNTVNYVNNTSNRVNDASNLLTDIFNRIYDDTIYLSGSDISSNKIYRLKYWPASATDTALLPDAPFYIKVQGISTGRASYLVSLDIPVAANLNTSYIKLWQIHYDTSLSKITYLKDEYGNEGNFDFRNIKLANGSTIGLTHGRNDAKNNYIYIDPENSSILFNKDSVAENCIINSTNILFLDSVYDNYIINSSFNNLLMQYAKNNKCSNIINSSLNIFSGNNNILINCENCSIKIGGNNNTLINVKNLNVSLGDNNTIIGDEIGCLPNASTLKNMKLFFNYSTSTALATNHISSCAFYGGAGNDVSVYVGSLRTTNK